jgi:hypothetical protein
MPVPEPVWIVIVLPGVPAAEAVICIEVAGPTDALTPIFAALISSLKRAFEAAMLDPVEKKNKEKFHLL